MSVKPSDFNFDGDKDKSVGNAKSEAASAIERMYNTVNTDRDAGKPKAPNPETAESAQPKPEVTSGESASFLTQKSPINYYDGKLSAGAGSTAETGLKGLFNIDRLNSTLFSKNDTPGPYSPTRVDGLGKDSLPPSVKVPDFVPKFPSA